MPCECDVSCGHLNRRLPLAPDLDLGDLRLTKRFGFHGYVRSKFSRRKSKRISKRHLQLITSGLRDWRRLFLHPEAALQEPVPENPAVADHDDTEADREDSVGEREGVDSERNREPVRRGGRQARRGVTVVAGVLQRDDGARARREGEGRPVEACSSRRDCRQSIDVFRELRVPNWAHAREILERDARARFFSLRVFESR